MLLQLGLACFVDGGGKVNMKIESKLGWEKTNEFIADTHSSEFMVKKKCHHLQNQSDMIQ